MYTILVLLLLAKYTREDGIVWFILFQSAFTAAAFSIRQIFPAFVERAGDLGVVKATRPLVFVLEPISVFLLGTRWEKYHGQGASFDFIFATLLALKAMECLAFSEVTGSNGFFITTKKR